MRIFYLGIPTIICGVKSKNIVGRRVHQARRDAKPRITQRDLVARLQVLGIMIDQSGLSKIENGQRPVSDIEVIALAKALKVSPAYLLEGHNAVSTSESESGIRTESDSVAGTSDVPL